MTGKERIMRILNKEEVDRSAYWLGNPHDDALKIYLKHFGLKSLFELADLMGNDMFWQPCDSYDHPEGRQNRLPRRSGHTGTPAFRNCG